MKICNSCGNENGDNAKFCVECGEKLQASPKICPECGTELVNQPKFCPECGNKILLDKNISDDEIVPINSGVKATIELCMIDIPGTQFSMLETPVTQELYKKVMGYNPSVFSNENSIGNLGNFWGSFFENKKTSETTENIEDCKRPVENISQLDAFIFCNELSLLKGKKPCYSINGETDPTKWGTVPTKNLDSTWDAVVCNWDANGYRLPTEAEWEYAARAGDNTVDVLIYSGTRRFSQLEKYVWYYDKANNVQEVGKLLENECYIIENIDATIIAQAPKMRPHIDTMRQNIADALSIDIAQVNVKATTEEGLGFTGRGEGISSQAICLLNSPREFATINVEDMESVKCDGCSGCSKTKT